MSAASMTISEDRVDEHFRARMAGASTAERDAILGELARQANAGDELAARTIRQLLLPICRRIAGRRGEQFIAAAVDAAYAEVMDWAAAEGHVLR